MLPIKHNQVPAVFLENSDDRIIQAIKALSAGELRLVESIHRFSQLRSYPLKPEELLEWKESVIKISGVKDLAELSLRIDFVVDKMMQGEIDYNDKIGIKNLFAGLKEIKGDNGSYKIKFTF